MDWDYDGYGGTITFPDGRTVYLQGEDAADLDDQIEECETDEQVEMVLSAYDHITE
jgi:hypothetical protein